MLEEFRGELRRSRGWGWFTRKGSVWGRRLGRGCIQSLQTGPQEGAEMLANKIRTAIVTLVASGSIVATAAVPAVSQAQYNNFGLLKGSEGYKLKKQGSHMPCQPTESRRGVGGLENLDGVPEGLSGVAVGPLEPTGQRGGCRAASSMVTHREGPVSACWLAAKRVNDGLRSRDRRRSAQPTPPRCAGLARSPRPGRRSPLSR
jgi:hypothetical protein